MVCGRSKRTRLFFAFVLFAAVAVAGCAAKKALWGDPETGLVLTYRMAGIQELQYESVNNSVQNLDVSGQKVEVTTERSLGFSIKPEGSKGKNQQLGVTINSMDMSIKSPQGDVSPDMSSVIGKAFAMTLSPIGEEIDVSAAKAVKYNVGAGGERSVASDFETLFPDLPGKPVKIGGTWTTRDTVNVDDGGSSVQLIFNNDNTLTGYETVDAMECAKISTVVTGSLSGRGRQGGADLTFEGDIKGNDTWYFAYKEGFFVKMTSDGTITGSITAAGGQSMVIPMTQTLKNETSLVKRTMKS
jgi:hypothetical protein